MNQLGHVRRHVVLILLRKYDVLEYDISHFSRRQIYEAKH